MNKKIIGLFILFLTLSFGNVEICLSQEEQTTKTVLRGLSFDKKTGIVSYELSVPALVRIRIGIADGPLYRTISDWQERPQGKHKEEWNGMDSSGKVKLIGREDLVFTFHYFTGGDEYLQDIQIADILPLTGNLSGRHLPNLQTDRMHKAHPRQICREPKIKIGFPKYIPKTKEDSYIIKNKTPIEISLAGEDEAWFRAERYSIHIFIDDVFVQGELDGYSPYTWIFDPKDLNEGKHLIVINLAGFNDHYGIESIPVYVKKKDKKFAEKTSKKQNPMLKSDCPNCRGNKR